MERHNMLTRALCGARGTCQGVPLNNGQGWKGSMWPRDPPFVTHLESDQEHTSLIKVWSTVQCLYQVLYL